MNLTDDAKREIAEAIRIVREDRFESYARGWMEKQTPKPADPPVVPPADPNNPPPPVPPTPADPPADPPVDPNVRKSAYWGEILSD